MKNTRLLVVMVLALMVLSIAPQAYAQGISGITLSLLEYSPQPVQPGQVMDVYLQLANTGDSTTDTAVELIEEYPFTIEMSQDLENAKHLGPITARRILQFRVRVANDAKDGIVPLRARYWSESRDQTAYVEKNFDINIQTFDARLDVTRIEQEPERIIPGQKGRLIITLQNHDDKPLKNIDVVLDLTNSYDINTNMDNMVSMQAIVNARLEDVNRRIASGLSPLKGSTPMGGNAASPATKVTSFDAFAPVGSSNQKRIASLEPYEERNLVFELMALPDIQPDIYAIPVYVNYNDEDNNPFHVRVDVPVTVDMEPELYVELSSSTLRTTDFSGKIVFTVANRGLSDLRYVTMELKEHDSIQLLTAPQSIYIGDLSPGQATKGNFTIIAHDKDITLPIEVSYRDSFNKEHKAFKFVPYHIINKNYYRDLPYEMWLAWLILGVVIFSLTLFYVKNLTKKRK